MSRSTRTRPFREANTGRRRRGILKRAHHLVDPTAVASGLKDRAHAEHGFTLIEVLVAALLVLIISAGVATALISSTDFTSHERNASQANAVAQQDQERMKSMSDSQLSSLRQTRTVTLNNTQFTVVSTATFEDANGNSSCSSGSNAYFKLTSNVTSVATFGNPAQTDTEDTVITRPLAGTMLVKVGGQTGTPIVGAGINVAGQNTGYTQSATTDSNGCAAFAGLPTDGYTITATDPGYVDPNGDATPTQTASVTQTTVATPPAFVMGPAGSVKVGFVVKGTSTTYSGTSAWAPELSYYGSGSGSQMSANACLISAATCTGTGNPPTFSPAAYATTITPGNMFPFYLGSSSQYSNNYQVWAGACEQEQPLQPPTGTGFASVNPGHVASITSTPDAIVQEPAIDVAVSYSGVVHVPNHVTITFTGNNATGSLSCTDVWHLVPRTGTEVVGATTYATYPAPFASTAAKGNTNPMASNTGDAGTIQVCADYNYSGSNYMHFTLSGLTTTNFNAPTIVPTTTATLTGACT
jgi:prepilin-type N-terminal cleavage/methylation domain-containing protein